MATIPRASTTILDTAGVPAGGLDVVCVLAPVATNPDITPRFYGSASAIYDQHGYSEGLEYAALHVSRTRKPVLFVGMPITTPGELSRRNSDGGSGTCQPSVTEGADGCLVEHDGVLVVESGGTVGTDQIVLGLSLDGGRVFQKLRVGTGNSVAIPYIGVTVGLPAGTLVTDETVLTWHGSGPTTDSASLELARAALAGQQKAFRSMLLIGDVPSSDDAAAFLAIVNEYETENERFVYGRASIADRLPLAVSSSVRHVTAGASLTFAAAGHTITRASGSWVTDGFAVGDVVYVDGSESNDGTVGVAVTAVSATVLTFGVGSGIVNEGPLTVSEVTGRYRLLFAASGDTITRSAGSWLDDGFAVGQSVVVDGSVSNDGTHVITALSATVMTLGASALVDETIGIGLATVTQSLTKAAWMAAQDSEFAVIDDEFRIDLSAGRWRILSPFSSWNFRRPLSWFASIREYSHDLHVATWRKSDGPISGADMFDEEGNLAEWDDRVDGGAGSAARFTTGRSWANGPVGGFITQSLTRGRDGSLLSMTHNVAVVNLVQTVTQLNTENAAIGVSLQLNDDGTATRESLSLLAGQVNNALERAVLVDAQGEGPRASSCVWEPSTNDVLNVPDATLTGVVQLQLNGTIHDVITKVRVISGGQ